MERVEDVHDSVIIRFPKSEPSDYMEAFLSGNEIIQRNEEDRFRRKISVPTVCECQVTSSKRYWEDTYTERMSMMMVLSLRRVSSKEKMLRTPHWVSYSFSSHSSWIDAWLLLFAGSILPLIPPRPVCSVKPFSCTIQWRLVVVVLPCRRLKRLVLNVCRSYVQSILRNFWNLLSRQHCELTIKSGRKIGWHLPQYPAWPTFGT